MRKKALLLVLALVAMLAFAAPVAMVFAQEPVPEAPLEGFFTNMTKVLPIAILMGLLLLVRARGAYLNIDGMVLNKLENIQHFSN